MVGSLTRGRLPCLNFEFMSGCNTPTNRSAVHCLVWFKHGFRYLVCRTVRARRTIWERCLFFTTIFVSELFHLHWFWEARIHVQTCPVFISLKAFSKAVAPKGRRFLNGVSKLLNTGFRPFLSHEFFTLLSTTTLIWFYGSNVSVTISPVVIGRIPSRDEGP